MDRATVAETVERWMEREPLAILKRHLQPGLVEFLDICRSRGLRLATLSDYPGNDKLRALGIAHYFDVSLCAQAKEIGVFKPNPKGLRVALECLGASPREALYVGDRPEVDASAADAAGMPCVIVTRSRSASPNSSYMQAGSYFELIGLLFGSG
jgi:putative hydrolase of the HAD superfamily